MRGTTHGVYRTRQRRKFQSTSPVRGTTRCFLRLFVIINLFQSTSPVRGTTGISERINPFLPISIHVPRAGDDFTCPPLRFTSVHFNPRPPCGGRLADFLKVVAGIDNFNPRPPCGGRLLPGNLGRLVLDFNPRPPCGGRRAHPGAAARRPPHFNPRPPCGGRRTITSLGGCQYSFQSTSPVRGTTSQAFFWRYRAPHFNPRPPCGGRLLKHFFGVIAHRISIHVPRAGDDIITVGADMVKAISIHVPRAGDDLTSYMHCMCICDFNPRPPCGGRHFYSLYGQR